MNIQIITTTNIIKITIISTRISTTTTNDNITDMLNPSQFSSDSL